MNKFVLTTGLTNITTLIATLHKLDPTQKWTVSWKLWKSQRSIDQNARYWKLITAFGDHVGYEPDEMHQLMGFKFLRYQKNGRDFIKSTTKITTAEMADYQDRIERFAADKGFIFEE